MDNVKGDVARHQTNGSRPGMNETFEKHKKLMQEKVVKEEEKEEEIKVGASNPFNTNWKMDKEKAGMVKTSDTKK